MLGARSMVAVFAHPDDAEHLFGGTVGKLAKSGSEINYVVCTDGSRGAPDAETPDEEVARTRADEQLAAARVLGVSEVVFLGYQNGTLEATAVRCHKSQIGDPGRGAWDFERDMKPHMRAAGDRVGCAYAESFRAIPIGR